MKILFLFLIIAFIFFIISCSEDNPQQDTETKGKLSIESIPPGAAIYLMGSNTGKVTPALIENLEPGSYNGYLYKQYYDTVYFSANISANATASMDFNLEDALPDVDFEFDYYTIFSGDSVKFSFTVNQDVLIDSIIVRRPADSSGILITDIMDFEDQLFVSKDQFGGTLLYYLPAQGAANQYYPRIRGKFYYFSMLGRKAYGAQIEFRIFFQIGL